MDKIVINSLKIFAHHGVNPEETAMGQWFVLDIEVWADLKDACLTDELEDTVSYADIIKTVRSAMTEKNCKLLEHAAQRIADAILLNHSTIRHVRVNLKKPDAPIKADFDYVAVEIERSRTCAQSF